MRWKDSSTWKLFLYSLLSYLLLTALFTSLYGFFAASREREELERTLFKIQRTHVPSLVEALWITDGLRIRRELDAMARFEYIDRAEVRDDEGHIFFAGAESAPSSDLRTEALHYERDCRSIPVGELSLFVGVRRMFLKTVKNVLLVLLLQTLLSILLAAVAALAFHFSYGKPLARFARFISENTRTSPEPFVLKNRAHDRDELGILVSSFNRQHSATAHSIAEINEMNRRLSAANALLLQAEEARRRSEERYRELADDLPALVTEFTADGRWTYVNRAVCESIGMSREALVGRRFSDFVPKEANESERDKYLTLTPEHPFGVSCHEEIQNVHGGRRMLEWYTRGSFDEHGNPLLFRSIGIDVTERKRMEEALLKSKESAEWLGRQAESANRAKSAFLANMSHELRTPLNSVIGFLDLLAATPLDEKQREYAEYVRTSAHSLLDIISNILDISKIETGKLELNPEFTGIRLLLEQAMSIARGTAGEKGLRLSLRIADGVPRRIFVDTVRLKQILVNLLGNAIKFTEKGEVELSISFEEKGDRTGSFLFSVRDTGIGIPEEKKKRLFEAFYQGDETITRRYGGTGLGLSICDALLQKMGSALELESAPGEGSRFFFRIAAEYAAEETNEAPLEHPSDAPSQTDFLPLHPAKEPSVLIVEDQRMNRLLLQKLVGRLIPQATVIEAADGEEGVEMFRRHAPDIVFMDLQMPGKDGFHATSDIRAMETDGRRTLIVALTADAQPETRERCLGAGMDEYLAKPMSVGDLRHILERWIRRVE